MNQRIRLENVSRPIVTIHRKDSMSDHDFAVAVLDALGIRADLVRTGDDKTLTERPDAYLLEYARLMCEQRLDGTDVKEQMDLDERIAAQKAHAQRRRASMSRWYSEPLPNSRDAAMRDLDKGGRKP